MKQYLMNGLAVLVLGTAFVACGEKDLYDPEAAANRVVKNYEQKFTQTFGNPSSDQDWGFGAMTRATRSGNMTGVTPVAQTSDGINANANEWADTANAPHGHGGWLVPPALTEEQKTIVAEYFQTHDSLTYVDPQWPNFFVQQVYKGDSIVKHGDTTEGIVAANGSQYGSGTMGKLSVGANIQHINNFNSGTASTVNVLNNGSHVNEFDANNHPDQIMLMVNIDDTQCMGYYSCGASVQRNDKAALVGYETIAAWADSKGYNGNCLRDGWNRSFVGFDLALQNLQEASTGTYAKFSNGQNNDKQYVWDGKNVLTRGDEGLPDYDLTSLFTSTDNGYVAEIFNNIDFSPYKSLVVEFSSATTSETNIKIEIGERAYQEWKSDYDTYVWGTNTYTQEAGVTEAEYDFNGLSNLHKILTVTVQGGDATISKIYLKGKEGTPGDYNSEYLLVDGKQIPLLSTNMNMYAGESKTIKDEDMTIEKDGKWCFNLEKIAELVGQGYLPVNDKNLREWVKFEYGDGYYSDWIVTLTEAKRQTPQLPSIRVMAEDLSVQEASDFDFNDIVIDFQYKSATEVSCVLQAAGGTLPLRINEDDNLEVHKLFQVATTVMVNTNAQRLNREGNYYADKTPVPFTITGTFSTDEATFKQQINAIKIEVEKETETGKQWITISANQGQVAGKIGCPVGTDWCDEKIQITSVYPKFSQYVQDPTVKWWIKN